MSDDDLRSSNVRWFIRLGLTAVATVVVIHVLIRVQGVLLVVAASLVIALGVQPFLGWLTSRGLSRGWSTAVLLTSGAIAVGSIAALFLPMVVDQMGRIAEEGPAIIEDLRNSSDVIDSALARFDPAAFTSGQTLGSAASVLVDVVTVAVLAPYFAHALPNMMVRALRLLHREDREEFIELLDEAVERISGFVAGNIFVSIIAAATSFVALLLLEVPFPAALAVWIGLADLVPIVGVFIGAAPAAAVAFVERGPAGALAVAVFIVAYQQVENYVIAPRVMRRTVDLSPATVIIALMVGGSLAGVCSVRCSRCRSLPSSRC